ncbi:unnamed protein product [Amoebophrya sp. A120]|nr:unnamed protein product [Amoebophrya sp. A120]|eukprot:GSA120T00015909001.1
MKLVVIEDVAFCRFISLKLRVAVLQVALGPLPWYVSNTSDPF